MIFFSCHLPESRYTFLGKVYFWLFRFQEADADADTPAQVALVTLI